MARKKYNFETDFHIHSPKEYPLMSVSRDNQYIMMLVPRRPSPDFTFIKMVEDEPIFNVHNFTSGNQLRQLTKSIGLREILSSHILRDYQYYNAPTREIREYPCIIMNDKIKKRVYRRNYMDFRVAVEEYNDTFNKLQLINIPQTTMDTNGEMHIVSKKEEQRNTNENKSIQLESHINTYPEIDTNNLPWFERLILYVENIINKIKNIFNGHI